MVARAEQRLASLARWWGQSARVYVCTDVGRLYTLGQHILALIGGRRAGIGWRSTRRFQIWDSLRGPFIKLRGAPPLGSVRARPPRTSRVLRQPRENSGLARDPFPLLSPTAYTYTHARASLVKRCNRQTQTDAYTSSFGWRVHARTVSLCLHTFALFAVEPERSRDREGVCDRQRKKLRGGVEEGDKGGGERKGRRTTRRQIGARSRARAPSPTHTRHGRARSSLPRAGFHPASEETGERASRTRA